MSCTSAIWPTLVRSTGPGGRSSPTTSPSARPIRRAGRRARRPGRAGDDGRRRPSRPPRRSPPAQASPAAPPPSDAELSKLRGAAARTAQNMAASLTVPTATSVRAVPAKLLIDNRIVINNHLQRGRGGKISFTHLIGYAVVQAVKALPEMNAAYAEEDGKPVLATPHHVNLGLAIDLQGQGRQQAAPGAEHQGRRRDGLPAVLDRLRGRRPQGTDQQADGRRLPGHHDLAHQPGHDRHRALGAAPDARPGHHRRRRGHGVPRRLPGRERRDHGQARDQQDRDADLDLRPPDHPGRAVRRLPADRPLAAAWRGRVLRQDLRVAAHTRTSRSAGSGTSRTGTRTT